MPSSEPKDAGGQSAEEPTVIGAPTPAASSDAKPIDPFADVTPQGKTDVVGSGGNDDEGVSAAADAVKARAGAAGAAKGKSTAAKAKSGTATNAAGADADAQTDAVNGKASAAASADAEPAKESHGRVRSGMGRARSKAGAAATDAKDRAVKATSDARGRAAGADVEGFARSTTTLIDSARPFFLAGCAAIFAMLGFLEGNEWASSIFAIGAILCVGGAAFSAEFNALLHARATRHQKPD